MYLCVLSQSNCATHKNSEEDIKYMSVCCEGFPFVDTEHSIHLIDGSLLDNG